MNNILLVSIIVPVYNSEKYLKKCLDSLINQTYQNIEILLINDGSEDNSKNIIEEYKKKSNKIKLIEQKNYGANIARKNGIKNCIGDYVMFVDSDDYILPNTVEELINCIKKEKADIVKFRYINNNIGIINSIYDSNMNDLRKIILTTMNLNNITTEIVSKKIIDLDDKVFNVSSSNGEDLLMNLSFYDKAKKVIILNNRYYYYTLNQNSTTNTKDIEKNFASIKEFDIILEFLLYYANKWNLNNDYVVEKIYYRNIQSICNQINRIIECNNSKTTIERINRELDNSTLINIDYNRIINKNEKSIYRRLLNKNIYSRHFKLVNIMLKIRKIIKRK